MSEASALVRLGREQSTERDVLLLPFQSLKHVAGVLEVIGGKYVLLLASDFTNPDLPLAELAERIVRAGCSYFCAWGAGCELIHDNVDDVYVMATFDQNDEDSVLMTTWHDNEPLADAVFFAVTSAIPVGSFASGCDKIILAVADRESWLQEAQTAACEQLAPHAI